MAKRCLYSSPDWPNSAVGKYSRTCTIQNHCAGQFVFPANFEFSGFGLCSCLSSRCLVWPSVTTFCAFHFCQVFWWHLYVLNPFHGSSFCTNSHVFHPVSHPIVLNGSHCLNWAPPLDSEQKSRICTFFQSLGLSVWEFGPHRSILIQNPGSVPACLSPYLSSQRSVWASHASDSITLAVVWLPGLTHTYCHIAAEK